MNYHVVIKVFESSNLLSCAVAYFTVGTLIPVVSVPGFQAAPLKCADLLESSAGQHF